jgi:hypothetical protein
VDVDADGNIFVAGDGGPVDFGGGPLPNAGMLDVHVAKLDPEGHVIWAKSFGGPLEDGFADLAVGADGDVVITGGYESAAVIDGVVLPEDTSDFWKNLFVVKLSNADGSLAWAKGYGDTDQQIGIGVAVDETAIAVAIQLGKGAIDLGGGPLSTGLWLNDIVTGKLSLADGSHEWSSLYGDSGTQWPRQVRTMPGGGHVFSAQSTGFAGLCPGNGPADNKLDALLWQTDPAGDILWAYCTKTLGTQYADGLAVDPLGNIVISGSFKTALDFGDGSAPLTAQIVDRYAAKLGPGGNLWWQHGYPGIYWDFTVVATDWLGGIVMAGDLTGTTDFGGGPVSAQNDMSDIVVVGLAP